jgi:hypothetical protein
MLLCACAGKVQLQDWGGGAGAPSGSRALYRVESESPSGSRRFRMAAALSSPSFVRLEFFGQVGGARLIVATDGRQVTILDPVHRTYQRAPDTPDTSERLLGLALEGRRLFALLSGLLPCRPEGRGDSCVDGDLELDGIVIAEDGRPAHVEWRWRADRSALVGIDYGSKATGPGSGWPAEIHLRLPRDGAVIHLFATQGPEPGPVDGALFAPALPAGFAERPLSALGAGPALLGSGGGDP